MESGNDSEPLTPGQMEFSSHSDDDSQEEYDDDSQEDYDDDRDANSSPHKLMTRSSTNKRKASTNKRKASTNKRKQPDPSSSSDEEDENPAGAAPEGAMPDVSNNGPSLDDFDECLDECIVAVGATLELKEQVAKQQEQITKLTTAKNKAQKAKRDATANAKEAKETADKIRAELEARVKATEREAAALRANIDELQSNLNAYQAAIPHVATALCLEGRNRVDAYSSYMKATDDPDSSMQFTCIDDTKPESQMALQQVRDNNPAVCQDTYCQGGYNQFPGAVEFVVLKSLRHQPTLAGERQQKASLDKRLATAIHCWNKAHLGEPPPKFLFDEALHAVLTACYVYDKDAEGDEVLTFLDRIGLIDRQKGLLACIHGNRTTNVLPNQHAEASIGCVGLRWTPTFGQNGAWFGSGFYFELRPCNPANYANRPSSLKCMGCGCFDKSTGYVGFPDRQNGHGEKTGAIMFFWVPVPGNPKQVLVRGEDAQITSSMSKMTGHPGSNASGTTSVLHVVPHQSHPASKDPNQTHAELILTFHGFYCVVGEPIPTQTFILSRPMTKGGLEYNALKHAVTEFGIYPHLLNFFRS